MRISNKATTMSKIKLLISSIYRFFFPLEVVDIYKRMGVKIGDNCKFQFDVVIDFSHYWLIEIGNDVTLAPKVHILAHDASTFNHVGYTKIGKVKIGDNVFIGANSTILPGVTIGNNAIIGAGSIVTKDIPENAIAVGNPAKIIGDLHTFLEKTKEEMTKFPLFEEEYTLRAGINGKKKQEMIKLMSDKYGFVR
jgi:maltose O-acetyltransferase